MDRPRESERTSDGRVDASTAAPLPGPPSAAPPIARSADAPRSITVLGATGSVGSSTLDLIGRQPEAFEVVAVTAQSNVAKLAQIAIRHRAQRAVIGDPSAYGELKALLAGTQIEAAAGEAAIVEAACLPADCVMAAIVGAAGLKPTLAGVAQGRRVALANKECLVSAGQVFTRAVTEAGCELIPVDSEHSAVFQALRGAAADTIESIVLTASGGPFRGRSRAELAHVRRADALKHPNWSMGPKITIDSATMMNKGLEVIEAFHLFPVTEAQLGVVVHPQSIVHSLVHFRDGSVLAQLSAPDMRTPIALSLSWPTRMAAPTARLDLVRIGQLTFEAPDETAFPALALAREALRRGGSAPAVLNAANEIAVAAFLEERITFNDISVTVERTLEDADRHGLIADLGGIDHVFEVDRASRELARNVIATC